MGHLAASLPKPPLKSSALRSTVRVPISCFPCVRCPGRPTCVVGDVPEIGRKRSQYPIYATTLRHNRPPPRGVGPVNGQKFLTPAGVWWGGGAQAPGAGEPPRGSTPRGPAHRPSRHDTRQSESVPPIWNAGEWASPRLHPIWMSRRPPPTDLGRPLHTALGAVALTKAWWGSEPRRGRSRTR